jgi:uncharacterized repeat protein (TIGR03803 family)
LLGHGRQRKSSGTGNSGTVFKITPAGKLTTLYSFPGDTTEGVNPVFPAFEAANGDFYGVTSAGGAYGNGVLFRITSAGKYALVASFHCSVNGCNPNLPVQGRRLTAVGDKPRFQRSSNYAQCSGDTRS